MKIAKWQITHDILITLLIILIAGVLSFLVTSSSDAASEGEELYLQYCAACHQPDGKGITGFFPPLANNPMVTSDEPGKIQ